MTVLEKFSLHGKVAMVTGGGRDLGKVIALALAEAGADVVVVSRTLSEVRGTAQEIREKDRKSLGFCMDVTDFSQVDAVVKQIVSAFGRIDILVNNAAIRSMKSILDLPAEEWRKIIETNLTGAFFCCKAVGPFMIRQGGGKIINISSRSGLRGRVDRAAYCASKGGLIQLTRALALEWAPYNILVNSVAPGLLTTAQGFNTIQQPRAREVPLNRAGEPEEIAPLVVYLASDACTYMTGEIILIDGGRAVK